jgi:hypothetical protein
VVGTDDETAPGTAAVALVRLWVAADGSVAARVTTVDDLSQPVENVFVTGDAAEVPRRLSSWIVSTVARLSG